MSPLYRVATLGTIARTPGSQVIHYERGHPIELTKDEANQLNAGYFFPRVVLVGEDVSAVIPERALPPREIEIKVSTLGVQSEDELRGAGLFPSTGKPDVVFTSEQKDVIAQLDDSAPEPRPVHETLGRIAEAADATAKQLTREPNDPLVDAVPDSQDETAPDWSTYLAAVDAQSAAAAIRELGSLDDAQAALEAEETGQKRPLVLRAGKAAVRRLGK